MNNNIDGIGWLYEELLEDSGIVIGVIVENNLRHYIIGRQLEPYADLQMCSIGEDYCSWSTKACTDNLEASGWFDMIEPIIKHHEKYNSVLVVNYDG